MARQDKLIRRALVIALCWYQLHLIESFSTSFPTYHRPILQNKLPSKLILKASSYEGNSDDKKFPYYFSGRLWFRPALVQTKSIEKTIEQTLPSSISILSLFGWTIGGVVALEYDESPVGPYKEYVTMGAVVSKRGGLGQWGSRLYVSTREAEEVCQKIWNVPAELANIDFQEDASDSLFVSSAPITERADGKHDRQSISVSGWKKTRVVDPNEENSRQPFSGLPVLWTPSIKALWAPLIPIPSFFTNSNDSLPLHNLRLSASAIRLRLCGQDSSDLLGIPIGIGLVVDNVLIEISEENGSL